MLRRNGYIIDILTRWGQLLLMWVSALSPYGLGNGSSPVSRQAITFTRVD